MHILAIQTGHNATVSLLSNGQMVNAVSQERFDNVKNSNAFPAQPIEWVLAKNGLKPNDIAHVAVCSTELSPGHIGGDTHNEHGGVQAGLAARGSFKDSIKRAYHYLEYKHSKNPIYLGLRTFKNRNHKKNVRAGHALLEQKLADLGLADAKKTYVDHHLCHAYSPLYFFNRKAGEDWLILTMDGAGDDSFCTVGQVKGGKYERLSRTHWRQSLGMLYSFVTHFLGMKVLEHEYKVMGLAAYAKEKYYMPLYEKVFAPYIRLSKDGLGFETSFPMPRFEQHLQEHAVGERFDNVAGAAQHCIETLVLAWVQSAVKKTGIANVMTSGGVFMNVKLNKRIQELDEVKQVKFMPSCGDESNVFGGAYYVAEQEGQAITSDERFYYGHDYTNDEIKAELDALGACERYKVTYHENMEEKIAELLADFKIVARFAGKAEFGARSLGNRALLANPSDMRSFYKVNDTIKVRDFWMPFAPSVLAEHAHEYVHNPDNVDAPFMITAFDVTEKGKQHLRAAMHQGDHSARPQYVTEFSNANYYKVIKAFYEKTGIAGVLNTSFNLHGYPLAETPSQAIMTLENSELGYLAMENWLVSKKA